MKDSKYEHHRKEYFTVRGTKLVLETAYKTDCCDLMRFQAGTEGFTGNDSTITYFSICNVANSIEIDSFDVKNDPYLGEMDGFRVVLRGDSELESLLEALKFIRHTLKKQCKKKRRR